jgi:hypothetical protein
MAKRPPRPKAYRLAETQTRRLRRRYQDLVQDLRRNRRAARLRAFEWILRRGRPAINMTLSTCAHVLRSGEVLTVFAVVAREVGRSSGIRFDRGLKRRLGKFYAPRLVVERLFGFDGKTTYASLNVGGGGPDYGVCCVRLEKVRRYWFSTCYAGDTITALFDGNGKLRLSKSNALIRFAVRQQLHSLAAVFNRHILESGTPTDPVDEDFVENLLSDRHTLVEIHIHEKVTVDNIAEISIARRTHQSVAARIREYEDASVSEREASKYDDVRAYLNVLKLADEHGIPVLGGGK